VTAKRPIRFVDFASMLRVELTPAQRVLALVAFDGVEPEQLESPERELATRLFGPVDAVPSAARAVVLVKKGARVGGSYIFGALYSLWRALGADLSTLAPGEQATALIVAPDQRLGRQVLRYSLGAAKSAAPIARLIENETAEGFLLRRPDGKAVVIEVLPATRGGSALRGRSLVSAVLSEASFFRDDAAVVNDQELYRAVAPRVLAGGLVVIESTPWAEQGLVYDLFTKNWGEPSTCLAADAPTLLLRPDAATAALVARERERDPENARREFGGEFLSGGSSLYFGPELAAAIDRGLGIRTSAPDGVRVTVGGDIGLVRDASAFAAVHRLGDHITLAELLELRPKKGSPLRLSEVVRAGCEFAERHGARVIHVDDHVLPPAQEHLLPGFELKRIRGGNEAKGERYRLLKEALRRELVHIPGPLVRVVSQLADVVGRPGAGGIMSITMPRRAGTHGDAAAAFVVAASQASDRVRGRNRMVEALRRLERSGGIERLRATFVGGSSYGPPPRLGGRR
jgi:hypothetical protein